MDIHTTPNTVTKRIKKRINRKLIQCTILGSCLAAAAFSTQAASGSFSTLSYNVAGLPESISSAETPRQAASEIISSYINQFDVVHLQEDYNYHSAIYDSGNNHPFRTSTTGGVPFGNGLNDLSRFWWSDFDRARFKDCNGTEECLGNKGFHMKRVRLAEGVYVDMYNTHFGAKVDDKSKETRRKQANQLLNYIASNSTGNSVIIFGDLNSRWTREGDPMDAFYGRGFKDAWVEVIRNGDYPDKGPDITCAKPQITSPDCEVVDKVLYWDNGYTNLKPVSYELRQDALFTDGRQLSDHPPVVVRWEYNTPVDLRMSDTHGGPHGTTFNNVSLLPLNPKVDFLDINTGERLDAVGIVLSNGDHFRRGGWGGYWRRLVLDSDEYVQSAEVCSGKHNSSLSSSQTRVFYIRFMTNSGRSLEGGTRTSNCESFTAEEGWAIVGLHGRAGNEVDRLGFIYAPVTGSNAIDVAGQYGEFVNEASDQCLDVAGGTMRNGQNVGQYRCSKVNWQRWKYDEQTGLVRSQQNTNYCLDNSGGFYSGSNLMIWECNGNANQRFTFRDGELRMRNAPGIVVSGFPQQYNVAHWWTDGGTDQRWAFKGSEHNTISIVSQLSGKCIDTNMGTDNGVKTLQWDCWGGTNQKFNLQTYNRWDPSFTIRSEKGNLCLSVQGAESDGADSVRGTQIHQWACTEGFNSNQEFRRQGNEIIHPRTGLCLSITDWSPDNGAGIILWDCNGGASANQNWKFTN